MQFLCRVSLRKLICTCILFYFFIFQFSHLFFTGLCMFLLSELQNVDSDMPPMPEQHLLDQQLLQVLESMNIPKAKVQEMIQQPNEKKWMLVWGQVAQNYCFVFSSHRKHELSPFTLCISMVQYKHKVRHTPGHYLNALAIHLEARDRQRRKVNV